VLAHVQICLRDLIRTKHLITRLYQIRQKATVIDVETFLCDLDLHCTFQFLDSVVDVVDWRRHFEAAYVRGDFGSDAGMRFDLVVPDHVLAVDSENVDIHLYVMLFLNYNLNGRSKYYL
jgi:hypothetical protein